VEPEVKRWKRAQHDSNNVQLEHRDIQMLNGAADTLKGEPKYLDGCKDTDESVCFVPVLDGVSLNTGEIDEAVLDKVVNLMGVDGKWRVIWRVKHEASHVGEERMCHGPITIPEFGECGHRVSGGEKLDLGE
jgi:hypothetical protein